MSDIRNNNLPISPFMEEMFRRREEEEKALGKPLSDFAKTHLSSVNATVADRAQGTQKPPSARNAFNNGITGEKGKYLYEGLPFRGSPGTFKHNDPEHMKPQLRYEGKARQFDLNNEEDLEEYNVLCNKICQGSILVSYEEKVYDNDIKSWRVLIRYADMYYENPKTGS